MRVVFMGSPDFAVPSLRALAAAHDVVGVYTQPDKPRRRGKGLVPTAVKEAALELGLSVLQPRTLRDAEELARLVILAPEVICVAAYGMILPPSVLAVPRYGCVNVHASLLPRHRGAAPVHRAILDGDVLAGVSIMRMEEGLDTGPFARVASTPVANADVATLTATLAKLGADALLCALEEIESGSAVWVEQDPAAVTYAAKITDADLALDPSLGLTDALRRVRASSGSARSKLALPGHTMDVVSASTAEPGIYVAPGLLVRSPDSLLVGLADGTMSADKVRPEGKAVMSGHAFALGARIDQPTAWGRA